MWFPNNTWQGLGKCTVLYRQCIITSYLWGNNTGFLPEWKSEERSSERRAYRTVAQKRLFQTAFRLYNPITVSLHFQSLLVQEAGSQKMSFQIIFGSGDLMRTPQWIKSCWGWHREEGATVQTTHKNKVSPEPLLWYRMIPWKLKRNIEPQAPPQTC